jgi:hypothetical protein
LMNHSTGRCSLQRCLSHLEGSRPSGMGRNDWCRAVVNNALNEVAGVMDEIANCWVHPQSAGDN